MRFNQTIAFFSFSFILLYSLIGYCILLTYLCVEPEHLVRTTGTLGRNIKYIWCGEREHPTLLVVWEIGRLVVWEIGRLVVWSFGRFGYQYIGVFGYWYIGVLGYWYIGVLGYWCIGISLNILRYRDICKYSKIFMNIRCLIHV